MGINENFLDLNFGKKVKIACIGDSMIDEYEDVKITRISPEHPIPVMLTNGESLKFPGGASNVLNQMSTLNVESCLYSILDCRLKSVLSDSEINFYDYKDNYLNALVPLKTRYMDNGIQVAPRKDNEIQNYGLSKESIEDALSEFILKINKEKYDVVILSDYNKGLFNVGFDKIPTYINAKTVVDPKTKDIKKWIGCTVFKPNSKEAEIISGISDSDPLGQANWIKKSLGCESVVITRGNKDIFVIDKNSHVMIPIPGDVKVSSVVGAGDCFASYLSVGIAHGLTTLDSATIARDACVKYVQKGIGNKVYPIEILNKKVVDPRFLSKRDFKLCFSNGCFDILHEGHINTLKYAKSKGDKLVVAINSDSSIKRNKGESRPVVPQKDRVAVISSLSFVDYVVVFDEDTPKDVISKIKPDVLIKGGDYNIDSVVGKDDVKEIHLSPYLEGSSTSNIIENYLQRLEQSSQSH